MGEWKLAAGTVHVWIDEDGGAILHSGYGVHLAFLGDRGVGTYKTLEEAQAAVEELK